MKRSREPNGAKLLGRRGHAFCLLENLRELLGFACWTKFPATRMDYRPQNQALEKACPDGLILIHFGKWVHEEAGYPVLLVNP